jgi:hypothetical protein
MRLLISSKIKYLLFIVTFMRELVIKKLIKVNIYIYIYIYLILEHNKLI